MLSASNYLVAKSKFLCSWKLCSVECVSTQTIFPQFIIKLSLLSNNNLQNVKTHTHITLARALWRKGVNLTIIQLTYINPKTCEHSRHISWLEWKINLHLWCTEEGFGCALCNYCTRKAGEHNTQIYSAITTPPPPRPSPFIICIHAGASRVSGGL